MIKRNGVWKDTDFNSELVTPFMTSIASSWVKIFNEKLTIGTSLEDTIRRKLDEVEKSVSPPLRDRARQQKEKCCEQAEELVAAAVEKVLVGVYAKQKNITRQLCPHVKRQLMPHYAEAKNCKGKGSVAKSKVRICRFLANLY